MHLIFENVFKNLMLLWSGNYKDLDVGDGEYQIHPTVWDAIGAASAASGNTIPSAFGPHSPNVVNDKTSWTTDSRSFWCLYVAPVVLSGRFMHRCYYDHFVKPVKLINTYLQYEITTKEVNKLRAGFAGWVQDYEKYAFQLQHRSLHLDFP